MEYKTHLKEALDELISLRVINDLLKKDFNSRTTLKNTRRIDHDYSDNKAVPEINGEWTVITSKNHMSKSGKCIQRVIDNSVQLTKTSNRYLPLTTLSKDNQGPIPVIVNRKITAKGSAKVNSGAPTFSDT
jgi:hypothetical protein